MNKLSYMKSTRQNFRESVSYINNVGMTRFEDKMRLNEKRGVPVAFKHNWSLLCHMHALRLWTVAYAPAKQNNLQRLQEMHRINNEALFLIQDALWKRVIVGTLLYFFICKMAKNRYLNNGAKDSHDVSFRDNTATL